MEFIWLLILAVAGALLSFSAIALFVVLGLAAFKFEPLEPKGKVERKKAEDTDR